MYEVKEVKKLTKEHLIRTFEEAKLNNQSVCVEVAIPGQNDTEYIINKNASIDNKLEYYLNTYNDNLEHKKNNEVKIISVYAIDFVEK